MSWWQDLSARERLLIAICAGVIALAMLVFLVIRPIGEYRANAVVEFEQATETYKRVQLAAASPRQEGSTDFSELRSLLTRTAQSSGIVINRIATRNQVMELSTAGSTPARLYGWLALLEEQHQVHVQVAQIRPASGNNVTALLNLAPGQ